MKKFLQYLTAFLLGIAIIPFLVVLTIANIFNPFTKEISYIFSSIIYQYCIRFVIWNNENYQIGIDLGYPKCCVQSFCLYPPSLLNNELFNTSKQHGLRFKAGHINGKFTGFISCTKCAKKVLNGKIPLIGLIKNRKPQYGQFKVEQHEM